MIINLIGPPGSGKGTLGIKLLDFFSKGLCTIQLVMSAIIDEAKKHDKELSEFDEQLRANGELLPDSHIIPLLNKEIEKHKDHVIILDGGTRTREQTEALNAISKKLGIHVYHFVIDLPLPMCVKRVREDATRKGRVDHKDSVTIGRVNKYYANLGPILSVVGDYKILDARQEREAVLLQALSHLISHEKIHL